MTEVTQGGRGRGWLLASTAMLGLGAASMAQAEMGSSYNLYGVTGLLDMPSAAMQPDAELATVISRMGKTTRTTLSFQILPRVQGSFRYSGTEGLALGGFGAEDTYYDRAFDVRFLLLEEGTWAPALTLGLQDFIGTGLQSSEYLVASKAVSDTVRVTGGLAWGRLGTHGVIGSVGSRATGYAETGGDLNANRWFRGDVAPFGGVEWRPNKTWTLKAEYSSDGYDLEIAQGLLDLKSRVNFGVEYEALPGLRFGAQYMYGSELGLGLQVALNPKRRALPGVYGPMPAPVALRPAPSESPEVWDRTWAASSVATAQKLRPALETRLQAEGVALESYALSATRAEVRIRNLRNDSQAQMIGRVARALSSHAPASVETFDIIPVAKGMDLARVRVARSDLERLEHAHDNARVLRPLVQVSETGVLMADHVAGVQDGLGLHWSLGPYMRLGLFDPDNPARADFGARLRGSYLFTPGLILSGSVTAKAAGNLDSATRESNSVLPRVRSEDYLHSRRSVALETLTLAWYSHPADQIYSRVTAGYLERSYSGVSGEVLWKPVDSRLSFGAELNYARQRSFETLAGLRDYGIWTGHVSGYYALNNGFHAQLDVGRYLAGDLGATLAVDREFANGWRVGAFVTKTDVSAEQFGEGSFDKGIRLTIPFAWISGQGSNAKVSTVLRPLMRDGGARLEVGGRLYETVRESHKAKIDTQWGRVWR